MALMTLRISKVRGRPPGFAGGINSLISSHCLSVKSVGYNWLRILQLYPHEPIGSQPFSDSLLEGYRRTLVLTARPGVAPGPVWVVPVGLTLCASPGQLW